MGLLAGKVAVVTGGSAGIGLAIARRFVAEGGYVYITAAVSTPSNAAVAGLDGPATVGVPGDASDLGRLGPAPAAIDQAGAPSMSSSRTPGRGRRWPGPGETPEQFARGRLD